MSDTEQSNALPEDMEGVEDFDAFWAEQDRKGQRIKLMGQIVTLPPSLPLQFEMEARKLQRSKRDKDVQKLVAILFGADALAGWAERGMDLEQFMVLIAWAPARIAGQSISLAEVAAKVRQQMANSEGEDETPADPS